MSTSVFNAIDRLVSRSNTTLPANMYANLTRFKTKATVPSETPFVSAYKDQVDYKPLYRLEDKPFKTRQDLQRFQKLFMYGPTSLSQEVRNLEYRWADVYFTPLTTFMGDRSLWDALGIYVPDTNVRSAKSALARYPVSEKHVAFFSGAHWISRRAGTKEVFDPYDDFQVYGTNQFCQTFAMMYLLKPEMLSRNNSGGQWLKYYTYTKRALDFIEYILDTCERTPRLRKLPTFKHEDTTFKNLRACLKVCKAHPYMCLNIINMPTI